MVRSFDQSEVFDLSEASNRLLFDLSEASDSLDLDVRNSEQITCFYMLEIEVPILFVFTGLRLVVASSWLLILIEEAYYIQSVYSEYSSSICSIS